MKKILVMTSAILAMTLTSCETVPSGHKGVKVNWGGKTGMEHIYNEGMTILKGKK